MSEHERGRAGKWVSQRALAQQANGREASSNNFTSNGAGAHRMAPPQPRSGGGAGGGHDKHHPQHANSTKGNHSHSNTAGASSPMVQAPQLSGLGGGGGPTMHNLNSTDEGRSSAAPPGTSRGSNNGGVAHVGSAAVAGRRPHASLFTEAGEIAPPQPRSMQRIVAVAAAATAPGKPGSSTLAAAAPHVGGVNKTAINNASGGGGGAPHSSFVPAPRHGALHHADPTVTAPSTTPGILASRSAVDNGGGIAKRWAQLGGGSSNGTAGPNPSSGGGSRDVTTLTASGSGAIPSSFVPSTGSLFSKPDVAAGFAAAPYQTQPSSNAGNSPFVEGLLSASGGGSRAFVPLLPREQQLLQQQQQQAHQYTQAGATTVMGGGSNARSQALPTATPASGNAVPQPPLHVSLQPQPPQSPSGGMANAEFDAVMQILNAALSSGGGGSADAPAMAGCVAPLQQPSAPQQPQALQQVREEQQPQLGMTGVFAQLTMDQAGVVNSSRSEIPVGDSDPTASFQNTVERLIGAGNDANSGSSNVSPVGNDTHGPFGVDNFSSILAALTHGMESTQSPESPSPLPMAQQQQDASANQFLNFSRAFTTGFAPSPNPATLNAAADDPIAASLFSQLTGDGETGDLAAEVGVPAQPLQPFPTSFIDGQPTETTAAVQGTLGGSRIGTRDAVCVPQPRSSINKRHALSEGTQAATAAATREAEPLHREPIAGVDAAPENEAWPSLAALEDSRANKPSNAPAARSTAGKPVSMAQAILSGSNRASGASLGVWRQVASQGTSTATSPMANMTNQAAALASEATTPCGAVAAAPQLHRDLSTSVNSVSSPALSNAAGPSTVNCRGSERSPMLPAPSVASTNAATPLTDASGRNSQPHTPAGAAVRLHRASLEAPTVTRGTIACIFRETPQSAGHRSIAATNREKPGALCRAAQWPPSNEGEVERLLKSKGASKLLRHLTIISFSRQHVKGVQELFDAWARNGIPAPDMGFGAYYFYVKEKSDKMLCMKHNGRGATPGHGYGKCDFESRRPNSTCRYEHVCLFCRSKEHGWFEESRCEGYQQLLTEVERLGVLEEDVETMLNAMERPSAWSR